MEFAWRSLIKSIWCLFFMNSWVNLYSNLQVLLPLVIIFITLSNSLLKDKYYIIIWKGWKETVRWLTVNWRVIVFALFGLKQITISFDKNTVAIRSSAIITVYVLIVVTFSRVGSLLRDWITFKLLLEWLADGEAIVR